MRGYVYVVLRSERTRNEGESVEGVEVFERKVDAEAAAGTWARSAGGRVRRSGGLWFGRPPERDVEADTDSAIYRDAHMLRRTIR